jgi:hypothetical protein
MPSKLELEQAFHQGKYMAGITKKLKTGWSWLMMSLSLM